MNIAMIMSGGVGKRFGAAVPKQYNLINGRPVIDYVIEACKKSSLTDAVVVVCDAQCVSFSKELSGAGVDIAPNGPERCWSVYNGLNYIKNNYNCDKICILDAVAPFVYPELIDDYFKKLDDYDCVITCQKITGELGNYSYDIFKREDFYISQSPEAFDFKLLCECFDPAFDSSEIANQLPKSAKRFLNFGFKNNLKITYDFELKYAEAMLDYFKSRNTTPAKLYEKEDFITEGLNSFLLRNYNKQTNEWLDFIAGSYKDIFSEWEIESFCVNRTSRFGLVLTAESKRYGSVVLKLIPEFINRYECEKNFYLSHKNSYMCGLIDFNDRFGALLLQQVKPGKYALFEDNVHLSEFWNKVFSSLTPSGGKHKCINYYDSLKQKAADADNAPYFTKEAKASLKKAVGLYDRFFKCQQHFYIHGDLHEFNIIKNNDHYVAIDPIGFSAPAEFEAVRFIRNDILRNMSFGINKRLDLLLDYFSDWLNPDLLCYAEYIDLAYTFFNSTVENESPDQSEKMLLLLNAVWEDIADDKI